MLATGLDSPEEDGADGLHTCGAEGVADSSQQRTQQLVQQQKQERQDTQHQDRQGGPGALPATAGAVGATAANTAPAKVSSEVMDLDSDGEHGERQGAAIAAGSNREAVCDVPCGTDHIPVPLVPGIYATPRLNGLAWHSTGPDGFSLPDLPN